MVLVDDLGNCWIAQLFQPNCTKLCVIRVGARNIVQKRCLCDQCGVKGEGKDGGDL